MNEKVLPEKLSFSRSLGAKILQGCVVAIDSGGCCRPYAPSRSLSPSFHPLSFPCYEHLSRCLLSSAPSLPYLSLSLSHSSKCYLFPSLALFLFCPQQSLLRIRNPESRSPLLYPKGVKTTRTISRSLPRSFQLLKRHTLSRNHYPRDRIKSPEIQSPMSNRINSSGKRNWPISRILSICFAKYLTIPYKRYQYTWHCNTNNKMSYTCKTQLTIQDAKF